MLLRTSERRTQKPQKPQEPQKNCSSGGAKDGQAPQGISHHPAMCDNAGRNVGRAFDDEEYPLKELTGRIIAAFHYVHHNLDFGHLESAYRRAMAVELAYRNIKVAREVPYELFHRGVSIGFYRADLVADGSVLIEVKAGKALDPTVESQVRNYLKVSRLQIGLILHFGPKPRTKRMIRSGSSNIAWVEDPF